MAILRALVEPELLVWARKSRGFSHEEVARRLNIPVERVQAWEKGAQKPTVKQLRRAAQILSRPIGLFFLPEPPDEDEVIGDFRRLPETQSEELSPALRLEIRLSRERRQEAIELAEAIGESIPVLPLRASLDDNPEELAARIRQALGISFDEQSKWVDKYQAFNSWRAAIEQQGVLVFQTGGTRTLSVSPLEARGFSIAEFPLPVIVANGKDAVTARCFTLIHELTHILLSSGGLCDFHERRGSQTESDRIEIFCNHVAGATLVPRLALSAQSEVRLRSGGVEWEDRELAQLSRRFWASWEVILRRLVITGYSSYTFYEEWRRSHKEPGTSTGIPLLTPDKRVIRRNGRLFSRLVLGAYQDNHITLDDVSYLLGAGPQHLEAVADSVYDVRYVA